MESVTKKASRQKKAMSPMLPQKEWLSTQEAAAYMDVSINEIGKLAKEYGLNVAPLRAGGKKLYYRVKDLKAIFERNALFTQ